MSEEARKDTLAEPAIPAWDRDKILSEIDAGNLETVIDYLTNPNCDFSHLDDGCRGMMLVKHATMADSPRTHELVTLLLRHLPESVHAADHFGKTALMYAVQPASSYALDTVGLLLHHDPSLASVKDDGGRTVLMHAAQSYSPQATDIISMLLELDPTAADATDYLGWTALMHAAESGSPHAPDIIRAFLRHDPALTSARDGEGWTALMHAAWSDSPLAPEIVHVMLQHDPSAAGARDAEGKTVLMHAVRSESPRAPQLVKLILQHDPKTISARDIDGWTVLMHAMELGTPQIYDVIRLLLQHEALDTNVDDTEGLNAFIKAVDRACRFSGKHIDSRRNLEYKLVELYIETCDYTKMVSHGGYSGLDHMIISGYLHKQYFSTCKRAKDLFKTLSQCATRFTLPLALTYCSAEICKELIDIHKDINSAMPDGETVLHAAIGTNSLAKCRLVMDSCPDIRSRWKGLSPFELAIGNRCKRAIIELVSEKLDMHEIEASIKKCLHNDDISKFIQSMGIQKWNQYFEPKLLWNRALDMETSLKQNSGHSNIAWLELEHHCSFKVRISRPNIPKISVSKAKVVSIAKNCRHLLHHNKTEVQRLHECVTKVILKVANVLKQENSFLAFECVLSGSVAENTKCYAPDEMDFVCLFTDVAGLEFEEDTVSELNKIRYKESSPWRKLATQEGLLDMRKLAQAFYDLFTEKILAHFEEIVPELGELCISRYPLKRGDKISQLQLEWNGDAFPGMLINVDVVPTFKAPLTKEKLPLIGEWEDYFLLSKTSRHGHTPHIEFHRSYCRAEHAIMRRLPAYIRDGYVFAKALRIAAIAGDGLDLERLDVEEDIRTDDLITSYILKNALFNVLKRKETFSAQNPLQEPETEAKCRFKWAEVIYTELEQCLENGGLETWYASYDTLFDCRHCTGDRVCCQKRAIMLALTSNIRTWIQQNMEDLRKD